MSDNPNEAASVPLDEQERQALADYEEVTLGRTWSSVVPRAIRAYYSALRNAPAPVPSNQTTCAYCGLPIGHANGCQVHRAPAPVVKDDDTHQPHCAWHPSNPEWDEPNAEDEPECTCKPVVKDDGYNWVRGMSLHSPAAPSPTASREGVCSSCGMPDNDHDEGCFVPYIGMEDN